MSKTGESAKDGQSLSRAVENLKKLHVERPSARLAHGKDPRSGITIQKILDAAHDIFIRDGYAGLSLRKVAESAGIAVGNLTYHFPTKDALIEATIEERLGTFAEEHLSSYHAEAETPLEVLLNVVAFYVRDARSSHPFFYQMWGYAGSSDHARNRIRELYSPIGRFVLQLVRNANPELDFPTVRRVVLQLFSLEEGYKLFIGMGPDDDIALADAESDIRDLARRIVMNS